MHRSLYDQLTPSQRKAVFHIDGPMLVLAGPGSGKTRVITHRIASLIDSGIRPQNICAITFTNKAADEMRQRVTALGCTAGSHISTFHSLCVRILRQYAAKAQVKNSFSIYDTADQRKCIKQAVKDCELETSNFPPARMLNAISALKNNLIDVETFNVQADDFFSKRLVRIYQRYQGILTEHNAMDFDDLLMKAAFLLERHPKVCEELSRRFRFLLVDEYQDTNHSQYRITRALVSAHNNICVTGDPDQSIYRWRGADIRNILAFEKDWPDAKVVRLEENFRSAANILEAADKLISFNQNRRQKRLIPTRGLGPDIMVNVFEDEAAEAESVVEQIKRLREAEDVQLNEIAVFYRINAQSRALEEAFIKANMPYQIVRGVEFYNRKEIRDLIAYLKILVNPDDEIALLRIINTPARGIGKTTIERIAGYGASHPISFFDALKRIENIESLSKNPKAKVEQFVRMIEKFRKRSTGRVASLTESIFAESGLEKSLKDAGFEGESALENVSELINSAAQYDKSAESPSLVDYLQQISLFSDVDVYDPSSGRVALMTLHSAKGLEFENVFIVGTEDGLLPHERSYDDEDEMEEERRLLFVGMTRAKNALCISCTRYRTIRGQQLRTMPSQFIYELAIEPQPAEEQSTDDSKIADNELPHYRAGQVVIHKSFGPGVVKNFVDMGQNSVVTVRFNKGQEKSLMVKFARLTKMPGH